jgi:two-component system, NarL family, response regulator LiaR
LAKIRVLIADDHAVVRQGLRTFLELQDDIEVMADAGDGEEAVAAALDGRPDVVLMDLVMPGLDGIEATRRILRERPATRVIALTSFLDDDRVLPAVRAGAAGYLLKDVEPQQLVRAIHTVHGGGALLDPAVTGTVMRELADNARPEDEVDIRLTEREREVLALVARGLPNKLIARELGIAEKTVKTHVSSLLAKLGVNDRTQAALLAVRRGWVEP